MEGTENRGAKSGFWRTPFSELCEQILALHLTAFVAALRLSRTFSTAWIRLRQDEIQPQLVIGAALAARCFGDSNFVYSR
jgi:hypothetical protein